MKVTIAWWNLDSSNQTITSLRKYLSEEGVDPWENIPGMRLKLWISDAKNNLWGAIMVWELADYMNQPLPKNRAIELIGYPTTLRLVFDIEASIEGNYIHQHLNRLGLCYEKLH